MQTNDNKAITCEADKEYGRESMGLRDSVFRVFDEKTGEEVGFSEDAELFASFQEKGVMQYEYLSVSLRGKMVQRKLVDLIFKQ